MIEMTNAKDFLEKKESELIQRIGENTYWEFKLYPALDVKSLLEEYNNEKVNKMRTLLEDIYVNWKGNKLSEHMLKVKQDILDIVFDKKE